MSPRLVAVSGPLAGRIFELEATPLTLGRSSANAVQIHDLAVSRQHCIVEIVEIVEIVATAEGDGQAVRLRDLDSRQGTFVNGVAVRERLLEPGDLIAVGASQLLYLAGGAEGAAAEPESPAALLDAGFVAESTAYLSLAEARPFDAGLRVLVEAGATLPTLRDSAALSRRLLELALEGIPAERGAVLLFEHGEEPGPVFARSREATAPFPVSRTLIRRVLDQRAAVLANGVLHGPEAAASPAALPAGAAPIPPSLLAQRIESLLCAPLAGLERPLGVLYLDTRRPGAVFGEAHLQLFTALAGIGGAALANVRLLEWTEAERRRLAAALETDFGGLVGESPRMREVARLLARVAPTGSTVLLRGESGTGKEVAARAIHRASPRAGRPFVALNCASLSETLLESELFGHERGAFTGALSRKPGKLEVADSGTVFLDEVGELPPALQARLLRVLQEREFERVGGTRPIRVDVRVIAATHRDLEKAMRDGSFRQDLFYRLNVITVEMPPLRERPGDIPLLASHFAARFSRQVGRPVAGFTPEARACLERYPWPGNVRELANVVERAVVLGDGELIGPEDLPEALLEAGASGGGDGGTGGAAALPRYHESLNAHKRALILDALARCGGHVTRAAQLLGLHPNYLHRLITNLELRERVQALYPNG